MLQAAPHIYALAEKAYGALISSGVNQAFVIRQGRHCIPVRQGGRALTGSR